MTDTIRHAMEARDIDAIANHPNVSACLEVKDRLAQELEVASGTCPSSSDEDGPAPLRCNFRLMLDQIEDALDSGDVNTMYDSDHVSTCIAVQQLLEQEADSAGCPGDGPPEIDAPAAEPNNTDEVETDSGSWSEPGSWSELEEEP